MGPQGGKEGTHEEVSTLLLKIQAPGDAMRSLWLNTRKYRRQWITASHTKTKKPLKRIQKARKIQDYLNCGGNLVLWHLIEYHKELTISNIGRPWREGILAKMVLELKEKYICMFIATCNLSSRDSKQLGFDMPMKCYEGLFTYQSIFCRNRKIHSFSTIVNIREQEQVCTWNSRSSFRCLKEKEVYWPMIETEIYITRQWASS